MAKIEGSEELGGDSEFAVRAVLAKNPELKKQLADAVIANLAFDSEVLEDIVDELANIIKKDPTYHRAIVSKAIEKILGDESTKELVVGEGAPAEEAEGYTEEEQGINSIEETRKTSDKEPPTASLN